MQIHLLESKIHRAQITAASLEYEGSLGIAEDLMEIIMLSSNNKAAEIFHGEIAI
jgi:aspartate 1-decarboxylase